MTTGGVTTIMTKVGPVVGVTAKGWKGRSLNLIDTLKKIIPLEVQPTTIDEVWAIPQTIIQVIVVISFEFIYLDLQKPTLMLCFKKHVIRIVCHLTLNILTILLTFHHWSLKSQGFLSQVVGLNPDRLLGSFCWIDVHCDACNKVTFLFAPGWNSRVPVDRAETRLGQSMMWSHESWSPHMLFEWITLRKTSISNHSKNVRQKHPQ